MNLDLGALARILKWLDADPAQAWTKYLQVRSTLLGFFEAGAGLIVAEDLTVRTLNRVGMQLAELEPHYPPNPAEFIAAIGRLVLKENNEEGGQGKSIGGARLVEIGGKLPGIPGDVDFPDFDDSLLRWAIEAEKPSRRRRSRSPTKKEKHPPRDRRRVVSTGFSSLERPDEPIDRKVSLTPGKNYYFWLQVGAPQKGSIEEKPSALPAVPATARLTVVLFEFKDNLEIKQGSEIGYLDVQGDGTIRVIQQPQKDPVPNSQLLEKRLFFAVRTPEKLGVFRMRCNIYWGQTLLQSRLIEARVTSIPIVSKENFLSSVIDYEISQQLDPGHLNRLNDHRLSVLLNRNEDGTHSFHFYGAKTFKQDDVRFDPGELDGMINQARGTLRLVSWGDDKEWRNGLPYKYKDRKPNLERLKLDLVNLAMWGYEFYTQIRDRLSGGEDAVERFEQLLMQPGSIQFAMKESPRYILPVALIYDHPFDTGAENYSLCQSFIAAFNQSGSLEGLQCLSGNCPSREDITTVCPSGFWGFRHYIGLPLSIKNGPDVPPEILVNGDLKLAVGVATDLKLLKPHSATMKKLRNKLVWEDADNRDQVFKLLKESPHLVYFYCHGGLVRNMPYLQLGPKEKPSLIQRSNIFAHKIKWKEPRPLVFINGCHTTAVAPTQALEFITPLVTYAKAAGVIGTEITIFEELATVFAEDCIGRFVAGQPIGKAVRDARLKLLKEGNPLGLVYIPFVMSGLTLVDKT